jgi:hypothetical protein
MTNDPNFVSYNVFRALEHPLQKQRFVLALIFAIMLFPLIAAGLIFGTIVLIVPLFGFLLWLSGRVYFAYFLGNTILVSTNAHWFIPATGLPSRSSTEIFFVPFR